MDKSNDKNLFFLEFLILIVLSSQISKPVGLVYGFICILCEHIDSKVAWLLWYPGNGCRNLCCSEKATYWMFYAFVWEALLLW